MTTKGTKQRSIRIGGEWDAAQDIAKRKGDNLSVILRDRLREYIEDNQEEQQMTEKVIPAKAVEAAWDKLHENPIRPIGIDYAELEAAMEAAAPFMLAPILALCDEADTRRGSSMYCKLTTYEIRETLGVEK